VGIRRSDAGSSSLGYSIPPSSTSKRTTDVSDTFVALSREGGGRIAYPRSPLTRGAARYPIPSFSSLDRATEGIGYPHRPPPRGRQGYRIPLGGRTPPSEGDAL